MTATSWQSIHVHHHGTATDRLIVEAVRPLSRELAVHGHRSWFTRHWRRGPHVRLHVDADDRALREVVVPLTASVLEPYLPGLPTGEVDVEAVLPLHRRLARLELEDGPLTPWRPDNSWHVDRYDDRVAVHGTAEASALTADFLTDTNDHAFAVLADVVAGGNLHAAVFDTMVALIRPGIDGPGAGHLSYRSHAEAHLAQAPDGERRRRAWDAHHRANAAALEARLAAVLAGGDASAPYGPASFVAVLERYQARGRRLHERGLLPLGVGVDGSATTDEVRTRFRELSPFHRALAENEHWLTVVRPSVEFALFRLSLNLMYLQFTRMGLSPENRYFLCHLVAGAAEARAGRTAVDVVPALGAPA
ncbi:thiopeptide maturation pyridine synthase [Micromonospora sp. AMSO12t]|uniref:thiopeptide maturation pyridine synthase n=1 Tax=Micromonospora sp. AMSO12t TaxID=2650410 RepID=UPI001788B70E|nr:thiopeptide maturation pyridine synthase [Micromonospora sp. AMSO12t]